MSDDDGVRGVPNTPDLRNLRQRTDDDAADMAAETIDAGSTRTTLGFIPSSYGAPGGRSEADEDGASGDEGERP